MMGLEVVKKVAEGSAVEAFLAKSGTHQVLVQVSRPELAGDPELYGRFLDQTRTATKLPSHPSLVSARVAHCSADGRFVLTSDPVSGRTAEDHLRERGPLSNDEAVRWALQLIDALEFLHEHALVHGYLAPRHVFLDGDTKRPDVKLLDTALLLFRSVRSLKSASRLVLVPPEYLSPERVAGQRATVRSDVYGLGVLLFELLTGKPPFTGRDHDETRDLHLTSPMPELPVQLFAWTPVLRKCLAKEPSDRYASMAELRQAVRVLTAAPGAVDLAVDDVSFDSAPCAPASTSIGPGTTLGSYVLEGTLGEGGMGQIFVARHMTLGRKVAIKLLKPELASDPKQVGRFVQEAQAVNRVKHPHIVEIHDLVRESPAEGGRTYFVMELLEGASLKTMGREQAIEVHRAVRFMRQAAEALAAAHGVGVVHRDLKPDNLFVVQDKGGAESVKVLDFGVAQVRDGNRMHVRMTQAGQVVGTPLWMAPEQVLGRDVDARADIYSLATVLYVLLTRRFPFDGGSMSEVVMQRLEREATPVGDTSCGGEPVPRELRDLVAECLSRDLSRRPETMHEVADRLRSIERSLEPHAVRAPTPPRPLAAFVARARTPLSTPARSGLRVARWGLALALALAAVVVVTRFVRSLPPARVAPEIEASPTPAAGLESPDDAAPPAAPATRAAPPVGKGADDATAPAATAPAPGKTGTVPSPQKAPKRRAAAARSGTLSLQTSPWSNVYFGDTFLGETPLVDVPMPPGRHFLKLVNGEGKLAATVEVEIVVGKPTSLRLKL